MEVEKNPMAPKVQPLRPAQTLEISTPDADDDKATRVAPSLSSPTEAAAAAVAVAEASTDLQKKLRRAERFGMPVLLSEEEKRSSRAERFGTAPISHGKTEDEKRKARAERFGTLGASAGDEEAKKKARLARFGTATKTNSAEEEKMKARALRFSTSSPSLPANSNGKSAPSEGNLSSVKTSTKT